MMTDDCPDPLRRPTKGVREGCRGRLPPLCLLRRLPAGCHGRLVCCAPG